jgi:hypothetical protein
MIRRMEEEKQHQERERENKEVKVFIGHVPNQKRRKRKTSKRIKENHPNNIENSWRQRMISIDANINKTRSSRECLVHLYRDR